MSSTIKQYFISRYNSDGLIMEADFSQLEVIYLAHLTKDKQLIKDLLSGMDMHTVRAAQLFGVPESAVTKEQRKVAKAFSFMLQYGSGAKHMAEETGHEISVAKAFIDNYYARYPEIKQWQDNNIADVTLSATTIPIHTPKGYPVQEGTFTSETGRTYKFYSSDSPEYLERKGKHTSFSPTTIKNYPVQGGATGDIVPMVLGKINRWLYKEDLTDKAHLIATVHDSIVLDIRKDLLYHVGNGVKKIMEDAPKFYTNIFGVDFDLPLIVKVTAGPSWADQREITL